MGFKVNVYWLYWDFIYTGDWQEEANEEVVLLLRREDGLK